GVESLGLAVVADWQRGMRNHERGLPGSSGPMSLPPASAPGPPRSARPMAPAARAAVHVFVAIAIAAGAGCAILGPYRGRRQCGPGVNVQGCRFDSRRRRAAAL